MIIADGSVEVLTTFESNDFILDKLGRGTVLNSRNFFKKEIVTVTFRCAKDCTIYSLDHESLQEIMEAYSKKTFAKKVDKYSNKIVK